MVRRRIAVRSRHRSKSRVLWASGTMVPWCVATALLVSFGSRTGKEETIGMTQIAPSHLAATTPAILIQSLDSGMGAVANAASSFTEPLVQQAHLVVGSPDDLSEEADEEEPKAAVKSRSPTLPAVNRDKKGDPAIGLRPTFETRLRRRESLPGYLQSILQLNPSDEGLPAGDFAPMTGDVSGLESVNHFVPNPDGVSLTTQPSQAMASPNSGRGTDVTAKQPQDGSTPAIARAESLGSSTPIALASLPIEIAPLPKYSRTPDGHLATDTVMVMGAVDRAPAFADLIDTPQAASEQRCLAQAVYFEARKPSRRRGKRRLPRLFSTVS